MMCPDAAPPADVAVSCTTPVPPIPKVTVACADADGPMVTEPGETAHDVAVPWQVAARVNVAAVVPVFQMVNTCGLARYATPPFGSTLTFPVTAAAVRIVAETGAGGAGARAAGAPARATGPGRLLPGRPAWPVGCGTGRVRAATVSGMATAATRASDPAARRVDSSSIGGAVCREGDADFRG
ncbi:MAG TPA: hypothetical protein VFS20_26675 [Longimicrobium sp.]|nr:hypothetical protein [Longimicrobium sp.]